MHTKTMEGLVGARTNMNLLRTPFRAYKEARRKGDAAGMERAMGYVQDYSDKADEYQSVAHKGMEEDAKAAREKAEAEREEAVRKRREEREELEKRLEEKRAEDSRNRQDTVKISEDGRVLLKEDAGLEKGDSQEGGPENAVPRNAGPGDAGSGNAAPQDAVSHSGMPVRASGSAARKAPVTYTKQGEAGRSGPEPGAGISLSV